MPSCSILKQVNQNVTFCPSLQVPIVMESLGDYWSFNKYSFISLLSSIASIRSILSLLKILSHVRVQQICFFSIHGSTSNWHFQYKGRRFSPLDQWLDGGDEQNNSLVVKRPYNSQHSKRRDVNIHYVQFAFNQDDKISFYVVHRFFSYKVHLIRILCRYIKICQWLRIQNLARTSGVIQDLRLTGWV